MRAWNQYPYYRPLWGGAYTTDEKKNHMKRII